MDDNASDAYDNYESTNVQEAEVTDFDKFPKWTDSDVAHKQDDVRQEDEVRQQIPNQDEIKPVIQTSSALSDKWQKFLSRYFIIPDNGPQKLYTYTEQILGMRAAKSILTGPGHPSGTTIFSINYEDLDISIHKPVYADIKEDLIQIADLLLDSYDESVAAIKKAVYDILVNVQPDHAEVLKDRLLVEVINTPHFSEISGLTNEDVDKVRRVEGTITQFDAGKQIKILENAWECEGGHVTTTEGGYKPKTCKEQIQDVKKIEECGLRIIREVTEKQKRTDMCYIRIQQRQDRLREGRFDPPEIDVRYEGAETVQKVLGEIYPGQYVSIDGVIRILHLSSMDASTATIEIEGSSFVILPESVLIEDDPELDKEVKREIASEEMFAHFHKLVRSIQPKLEGLEYEKIALLAQLAGADSKILKGGSRQRGDLNILLVSTSGLGKTELLKFQAQIRPRSVYVIGRSASAVGLTAGIEHVDVMRGGQRVTTKRVSFGAYALARDAIVCLDELDKRDKVDFEDLSHPMDDQQELNVSKAGIYKRISAACGSLHAGNPIKNNGIYDKTKNFFDQINFANWLSSRYDLIFVIGDENSDSRRNRLWSYISDSYKTVRLERDVAGSIHNPGSSKTPIHGRQKTRIITDEKDDWYPWQYLRREILYVREKYHPILKPHTLPWDLMMRFWNKYNQVNLTPVLDPSSGLDSSNFVPALDRRKIGSISRVSEAIARLFRSDTVEEIHMDIALSLFKHSINSIIPEAPQGYANPQLLRTQLTRTVADYASKEIKRGIQERVRDYRKGLYRFTKWLDRLVWDRCPGCGGKGETKFLQDETAHYYSYGQCTDCAGSGGQYRTFRYVDILNRIPKESGINNNDVGNYFNWLLKVGAVSGIGNQKFKVTANLKDKNLFSGNDSEIFVEEPDLETTESVIKPPKHAADRKMFNAALEDLKNASANEDDIY